ncbi:MAG: hypothetical protein RIR87_662 [Actinomycetota bacterium]
MQFPSCKAITPRARVGGASFSCGYLLVRVLHGIGAFGHRLKQRAERDPKTLHHAGNFCHYITTLKIDVSAILPSDTGMSTFQAKRCN